jgi:hypothetical protein
MRSSSMRSSSSDVEPRARHSTTAGAASHGHAAPAAPTHSCTLVTRDTPEGYRGTGGEELQAKPRPSAIDPSSAA